MNTSWCTSTKVHAISGAAFRIIGLIKTSKGQIIVSHSGSFWIIQIIMVELLFLDWLIFAAWGHLDYLIGSQKWPWSLGSTLILVTLIKHWTYNWVTGILCLNNILFSFVRCGTPTSWWIVSWGKWVFPSLLTAPMSATRWSSWGEDATQRRRLMGLLCFASSAPTTWGQPNTTILTW